MELIQSDANANVSWARKDSEHQDWTSEWRRLALLQWLVPPRAPLSPPGNQVLAARTWTMNAALWAPLPRTRQPGWCVNHRVKKMTACRWPNLSHFSVRNPCHLLPIHADKRLQNVIKQHQPRMAIMLNRLNSQERGAANYTWSKCDLLNYTSWSIVILFLVQRIVTHITNNAKW